MPYPDVVEHVGERVARAGERSVLAVDGTGVGVPVVDLLRKEQMGCWLLPVTITGGNGETRRDGFHGVPRRDLLQGLRVGLEKGRAAGGGQAADAGGVVGGAKGFTDARVSGDG